MSNSVQENLVPPNKEGKAVDLEQTTTEKSLQEATDLFQLAKTRLLNPAVWNDVAGAGTASFAIWNNETAEAERPVQENDYLQIDIPGPGPAAGEGYDWVKVEALQENAVADADESVLLRVRASTSPANQEPGTAHFFTDDATSTFILQRLGLTVTCSYHGRNEKANTADVQAVDKIRNGLVATGAVVGLSEVQWTALLKGFLKKDNH